MAPFAGDGHAVAPIQAREREHTTLVPPHPLAQRAFIHGGKCHRAGRLTQSHDSFWLEARCDSSDFTGREEGRDRRWLPARSLNEPITHSLGYTGSHCAIITLSLDALHVLSQQIRVEALGQAQQSWGPPRMMPSFFNINRF
jgi:hypothetical protein